MLDAFKIKPFDLEPIYAEWKDGPMFKGNPKKDPPVDEWLDKIKTGCQERNIPEEYWYKVAQHFMGPKAKARFDEVKQVVVKVHGGKYRWTWKKFKIAMQNMGWYIDANAIETIKVQGKSSGLWFTRKKTSKDESASGETEAQSSERAPPTRSNSLWITRKPVTEEPEEVARPIPSRSKTITDSSFWNMRRDADDDDSVKVSKDAKEPKKKETPTERPTHQKARSETAIVTRKRSASKSSGSSKSNSADNEAVTTITHAPVWLLNACNALDFLTNEHPKTMSVMSAILITVGSIPAIPAISAGAGGAILASGAAHAIGAIAVGLGQALGAAAAKSTQSQHGSTESTH